MCLSVSCVWALTGAFIYVITSNPRRNLQGGYCYFQVTGEHMTLEGSSNLLRITQPARGLACSLSLA